MKDKHEPIYNIFSLQLRGEDKQSIIPILVNIQYLLEVKNVEIKSNHTKNVFEPQREKEISQLLSWYLMEADHSKSLQFDDVKVLIKYINEEVLETYCIADEDYTEADVFFNPKNMISFV